MDGRHGTARVYILRVELDGKQIGCLDDFHRQIGKALDFGHDDGRNLNALWDMLSGSVERPLHLVWIGSDTSNALMGEEAFESVVLCLQGLQSEDEQRGALERFTFSLEKLRKNKKNLSQSGGSSAQGSCTQYTARELSAPRPLVLF